MAKFKNRARVRLVGTEQRGIVSHTKRMGPSDKFFVQWEQDAAGNQVSTWHWDVDLERAPDRRRKVSP